MEPLRSVKEALQSHCGTLREVTEALRDVLEGYGSVMGCYGTLWSVVRRYRMLWKHYRTLRKAIEVLQIITERYGTITENIDFCAYRHRMHSSTACATCTMSTVDEFSQSADGTLHPHHTWPTTPNDTICVHTPNYCDYFCTINWSELVYGHFDTWTFPLGFSLCHWLRMTSWCLLSKKSNTMHTCRFLWVGLCRQLATSKWLLHFCKFFLNPNFDLEPDCNIRKPMNSLFQRHIVST